MIWTARGYRQHGWACEQCTPETRERRGNCGGPLSPRLKYAEVHEGKVRIPAATWLRGEAAGDVGGYWISCPIAEQNAVDWLVGVYKSDKAGVARLAEIFEQPTIGLLDAMTEFMMAEQAVDKAESDAEERRRRLKGKL